ncbi:MAG: DUF6376 family protein [Bacillus sp. (in: firmicutes)]
MKKGMMGVFSILTLVFVGGCSMMDEVNESLEYGDQAMEYIEHVQIFSEELPALAEEAIQNSTVEDTLEQELESMKEEITAFNELEAPAIAEKVHEEIESVNLQLSKEIDSLLAGIEAGIWEPEFLENSTIMETINQFTELQEGLEQLEL